MKSFDEKFDAAFSQVAFTVNRHLIRHMQRLQTELEMDLETTYLWGILAHLNYSTVLGPAGSQNGSPAQLGGLNEDDVTPISANSLAQVAGYPRETVRRKLDLLLARGKVERDARKRWIVTKSGVDEKTYDFTKQTVIEFLKAAEQVKGYLGSVN